MDMARAPSIVVSPTPSSRVSLETTDSARRLSLDSQRSGSGPNSTPSGSVTGNANNNNSSVFPAARRTATGSVRNRSALREFYGLKQKNQNQTNNNNNNNETGNDSDGSTSAAARVVGLGLTVSTLTSNNNSLQNSPVPSPSFPEMDRDNFDAQGYVNKLIEREDLRGLLRVENELVNDIRGLDGDRKSLVYDNYNKLISATDTIRNMRSSMDPMTPATSTLFPAVAHIASTSEELARMQVEKAEEKKKSDEQDGGGAPTKENSTDYKTTMKKKKETVRWVLLTPDRMEKMVLEGNREGAVKEWEMALKAMGNWKGVGGDGLEKLKARGEAVLAA